MITLKIIVFIFITTASPPAGKNAVRKTITGKWIVTKQLVRKQNKFKSTVSRRKQIYKFRKNGILSCNKSRKLKHWKVSGKRRITLTQRKNRKKKEIEIYFARNKATVLRYLKRIKNNPNLHKILVLQKK